MKQIFTLATAAMCLLSLSAQDVTMLTHHDDGEILLSDAADLSKITFEDAEFPLTADGDRILGYTDVEWPEDRLLPRFPAPDKRVYALDMDVAGLNDQERVMFASLQGLVNRSRARILLYQGNESRATWPAAHGLRRNITTISARTPYQLVERFKDEIEGLALYSTEHSEHYGNVASTVGGLKRLLPVTPEIRAKLIEAGVDLPVVEDFTSLTMTTPVEIYQYLYDNYWSLCNHRLLISLRPVVPFVRDLGVASGSMIVWLDPRVSEEKAVLDLMLQDLTPGRDIVTGWFPEERSGIGECTKYGLSCVPSDFFENGTVYSSVRVPVRVPAVPKMPELENKVYVTFFISDGDNIQYCEHAMLLNWNHNGRGQIPMNWTISPSLADFAPAMLNNYYDNATEHDCFASGPSGIGYAMPYDAHNFRWNVTRNNVFEPYVALTGRYVERAGLRIITIWDKINDSQHQLYARNCPYLYGLTIQDWERQLGRLQTSVADGHLPMIPNYPCYANGIDVIANYINRDLPKFDGTKPMFLTSQGSVWDMGPDQLVGMVDKLDALCPGNYVILRGDHFFNMYNRANGLLFNLALLQGLNVTSSASSTDAALAADGSPAEANMWVSSATDGTGWVQCDFGKEFTVSRFVIRHAATSGLSVALNSRAFKVEVSTDGNAWTTVADVTGNTASVTDTSIEPVAARYLRLTILDAGSDAVARIADLEVYGSELQ